MYYLLVFAFVLPVASCAFISPTCPNPNNVLVSCGICERSSTWSSSPVCFPSVDNPGDDPICALASRTFANGRGISMLATSPVLRRMQTLDIFQNYEIVEHANEEEKSPPWIVRDIPNRGKGVIATRQINRGDRIMTNTPILVIDWTNLAKFEEERNFMLQEAVNALPRRSQKLFWNLQAHLGQGPIEARIRTNSHGVLLDDILHYGIFPEQAVSLKSSYL